MAHNMWKTVPLLFLSYFFSAALSVNTSSSDQSALMNIWNYDIKRNVKTSVTYKQWDLGVWEEVIPLSNTTAERRYYVTPPVVLLKDTARCDYVPITRTFDVSYDVQLWERELPKAVSERLKDMGINIKEDQINPLPFYQARIVWNSPDPLQDLKLSPSWINNLQQQKTYTFSVTAANNASCQLLVDTIRKNPAQFVNSLQLQFTVSAAKIDSKLLDIKSEHIVDSQLVASLKNLPGVEGNTRYLSSNDYNRMLLQIANQVVANEITSGDYVDADDELSLKDTIANMLNTQKENSAQFDDKMWNSVFWDPLNERPDRVTKEMNKFFKFNQTDNRWYMNQSQSSSSSDNVNAAFGGFSFGGGSSGSSSSSKTTDDMRHLMETYDIESEIDGDKFLPKKMDLTRMNMNDLTRKDALTTKRVRVRQVDIGGVLQVAIGNSTTGEIDDENRFLRQQINEMEQMMKQVKSDLQKEIDRSTSSLNQAQIGFNQNVSNLASSFNQGLSKITSTLAQVSSTPNAYCTEHQTPPHTIEDGNFAYLLFHDVRCPAGKVLTRFQLYYPDYHTKLAFYGYTCCSLV